MSNIAIQTDNLSKQYHIGKKQDKYRTLRDVLVDSATAPFRRAGKLLRGQATGAAELDETIWALKDVSINVDQGEVVGIIGRNGAGKTTLLKILSRITEPTTGFARIRGRVSSLLEVGTGFHNELTGRENVYLNGSILGMSRAEIENKFDEIVAFSEVEKFIDTPIKHYSSGMKLRLAFAVAAHLEPEIMIIDEVLAVGDARFQKKCLNKMQDVGEQGRTVLFVSHNMPAVTRLCERVVLLDEGQVLADGPAHEVVGAYLNSGLGTTAAREWSDPKSAPGKDVARLRAIRIRNDEGEIAESTDIRKPVSIEMEYDVLTSGYVLLPSFHLFNADGICLFVTADLDPEWHRRPRPEGRYLGKVRIPGNFLAEGTVFVSPWLQTISPDVTQFSAHHAVAFQVFDTLDGDSARGDSTKKFRGVVRPLLEWTNQHNLNGHEVSVAMATNEANL